MGQKPTDEEVFNLIALVDDNMSNTIDFPEFLKVCHMYNPLSFTMPKNYFCVIETGYQDSEGESQKRR